MTCGKLELIVGPMFAGKTTELIRRIMEARKDGECVEVYKPRIDTRHHTSAVISHDNIQVEAKWVGPDWGTPFTNGATVLAFDEIQFFSGDIVPHIKDAIRKGVRVIAAGLDLTSQEEPFGPVPALCAFADDITKLRARCVQCGQPATRSQRLIQVSGTVLIGGADSYEPRCIECFDPDPLRGG